MPSIISYPNRLLKFPLKMPLLSENWCSTTVQNLKVSFRERCPAKRPRDIVPRRSQASSSNPFRFPSKRAIRRWRCWPRRSAMSCLLGLRPGYSTTTAATTRCKIDSFASTNAPGASSVHLDGFRPPVCRWRVRCGTRMCLPYPRQLSSTWRTLGRPAK